MDDKQTKEEPLILVVDDTLQDVQVMVNILQANGYNAAVAMSGREAIDLIDETFLPDLILLDVVMPEMSGFETCRHIKKEKFSADIPIIFLTSQSESDNIIHGFKEGCADYVCKPFNSAELLARIKTHIDLQRALKTETALRAKAEEGLRIKKEFIACISHEIRTPMNAITGYTGLIKPLCAENKIISNYLKRIDTASNVLIKIIENMITIADMDASAIKSNFIPTETKLFIDEISATYSETLNEKNVQLLTYVEPDVPKTIITEPAHLRVALMNIVDNAVKFTNSGHIRIALQNGSQNNHIEFSVEDTGVGIPEEELNSIFESFRQQEKHRQTYAAGVGLGLSIARRLTRQIGGDISVASNQGEGSRFTLSIPAAAGNYLQTEGRIEDE